VGALSRGVCVHPVVVLARRRTPSRHENSPGADHAGNRPAVPLIATTRRDVDVDFAARIVNDHDFNGLGLQGDPVAVLMADLEAAVQQRRPLLSDESAQGVRHGPIESSIHRGCARSSAGSRAQRQERASKPGSTRTSGTAHYGYVEATYPSGKDGDPDAVPGIAPEAETEPDASSFSLEVDGELFVVRVVKDPATYYTDTEYSWLSGPNKGYGFGVGGPPNLSLDDHRVRIREFLAGVDPSTGYLEQN
jgi:hypothetical protein